MKTMTARIVSGNSLSTLQGEEFPVDVTGYNDLANLLDELAGDYLAQYEDYEFGGNEENLSVVISDQDGATMAMAYYRVIRLNDDDS